MSEQQDIQWLKQQVVELQSQLAFQEDVVQSLNDIVTRQQQQMENLQEMLQGQKSQLEALSAGEEGDVVEEKPPHY